MTLTGSFFLALVVILTVAAFAGAVVVMPRLRGRSLVAVPLRVGCLVGVNLLVLLTAAIALNDQYLFYADWTDLYDGFGGHVSASTTSAGGAAGNALRRGGSALGASLPTPGIPAGASQQNRVLRFTVTGATTHLRGGVDVLLPVSYFSPANRLRRYPVLEAFHGFPGAPDQWVDTFDLPAHLDALAAAHRIADTIVVIPTLQIPPGRDTECVNGGTPQTAVEDWLSRDVPDWLSHGFRVQPDRTAWATIGFSEGGWCAAMVTMLHPDRFAAAVVLGGYFRPDFGRAYRPFPLTSPQGRRYDLVALTARRPPPVALWVQTSHSDPLSYGTSDALLRAARPPLSVTATVLAHAGHRIGVWLSYLDPSLVWLGRVVPGFRA
jgi:hypothetical protein